MKTEMLVDEAIEELQNKINDTAIIACSGGIDSSVAAVLAHRAVGSLLHCVYVDTGFMRKNESFEVAEMFAEMGIDSESCQCFEKIFLKFRRSDRSRREEKNNWRTVHPSF